MSLVCKKCGLEVSQTIPTGAFLQCTACGQELAGGLNSTQDSNSFIGSDETTRNWHRIDDEGRLFGKPFPVRFGRYEVRKQIGRGGFARVLLAWDHDLEREVALKVPRADRLNENDRLAAMLPEARIVSRLRHPGIATVYDAGILPGTKVPFISMELIPNGTFRAVIESQDLSIRRVLESLADVADAVHHANLEGLIHRDLKPGNILIDTHGSPRIVDFGLAIDEIHQLEMSDMFAGTPSYMAPEQVRGEVKQLDGRTDLWALGIMLYEILTGRHPFNRSSSRLREEILKRTPRPPRQIDDSIPVELEEICLKCLAKSANDRFRSCGELSVALRKWLTQTAGTTIVAGNGSTPNTGRFATRAALIDSESLSSQFASTRSKRKTDRAKTVLIAAVCVLFSLGASLAAVVIFSPNNGGPVAAGKTHDQEVDLEPLQLGDVLETLKYRLEPVLETRDQITTVQRIRESDRVLVTTSHPLRVKTGTSKHPNFRLEIRFSTTSKEGTYGLFLGGHSNGLDPRVARNEFQYQYQIMALRLLPLEDAPGDSRLSREQHSARGAHAGAGPAMDDRTYIDQEFGVANENVKEHSLELKIIAGMVTSCRFDGRMIDRLVDSRIEPPKSFNQGEFGLYVENGSMIVSQLEYEVIDGPAP